MTAADFLAIAELLAAFSIPVIAVTAEGVEYGMEATEVQRGRGDRIFAAWPAPPDPGQPPEPEPEPPPVPVTSPERVLTLHNRLSLMGIPAIGVARDRIDFGAEATEPQRATATALFDAWDWDAPPVPAQVTATQAKLALIDAGLYEAVDVWITGAEAEQRGFRYRVVWDASNWYRTSRELNEIAGELGLTDPQVDDLFRLAATK